MESIYDNDDLFLPETESDERHSSSGIKPEDKRHPSMDESIYLNPDMVATDTNRPLNLPGGHPSLRGPSNLGSPHHAGKTRRSSTTLKVLLAICSLCLALSLAALAALGHFFLQKQSQLDLLMAQHKNMSTELNLTRAKRGCTPCAEFWRSHGDKCYFFSLDSTNWTQSRDDCVAMGGHLAIINDNSEQIFLSSQTTESHWIGLNDRDLEGQWLWVDNSPLTRASPQFWFERSYGRDEPDNWISTDLFGEDCASLGDGNIPTNVWFDENCQKQKRYICESVGASQDRYNVCK